MMFATGCCTQFKGKVPGDLDNFYVIAPQDDPPQSLNASFRHDHVVRDIPAQNHGTYSTRLHGFFVLCSDSGIASGACVFEMNTPAPGLTLPFAMTVNGQSLTSVEPLEAAVDAGLAYVLRHRRRDRRLDQPEQVETQPRSNRRACRDDQRRMTKATAVAPRPLRTRTS